MDYALLAATALGAIGLYLMLPRERAPLVRLGGLLGAMALAGLFLYLVRTVAVGGATGGGEAPPVYFYIFSAIMIGGAVGVVCQPKPVYAALYFVLVTLAGAGLFVLLLAEFMAIVLIIIYAGAILVTYVFVIMLASQSTTSAVAGAAEGRSTAPEYDRRAAEPFMSVLVSFILLGTVLQVIFPTNGRIVAEPSRKPDALMAANLQATEEGNVGAANTLAPAGSDTDAEAGSAAAAATTAPAVSAPTNVQVIGSSLYSQYALSLELAGILLTIALVGAVVIARKYTSAEASALGSGQLPAE